MNDPRRGKWTIPLSAGGSRLGSNAVGQLASVPSLAVRAIERGTDASLSQLQAVASVIGLTIELVDQAS